MRWSEPVDLGPGSVRLLDATGKADRDAATPSTSAATARPRC